MRAARIVGAMVGIALLALGSGGAPPAGAAELVLHPGWVDGVVAVPGWAFQGSEGGCWVTASGTSPDGKTYTSNAYIHASGTTPGAYRLTVEGGDWAYTLEYTLLMRPTGVTTGVATRVKFKRSVVVAVGATEIRNETLDAGVGFVLDLGDLTPGAWGGSVQAAAGVASTSRAYGYTCSFSGDATGQFTVPVFGDCAYDQHLGWADIPALSARVSTGRPQRTVVPAVGGTDTYVWAPALAFVQGCVTGVNGTIASGSITLVPSTPNFQWQISSAKFAADGVYRAPVLAGTGCTAYCSATFANGVQASAPARSLPPIAAGEAATVDWTVTAPLTGSIAGVVDIGGVDPVTSIYSGTTLQLASEGPYRIDNLLPHSNYSLACSHRLGHSDDTVTEVNREYRWPWTTAPVVGGQTTTVDFRFDAGFIGGNILAPGSLGEADMRAHTLDFRTQNGLATGEFAESHFHDWYGTLHDEASRSDTFVRPGLWRADYLWFYVFTERPPPGSRGGKAARTTVRFLEGSPAAPYVAVGAGEHASYDLNLRLAKVLVTLRIADGSAFQGAYASAEWLRPLEGADARVTASGHSDGSGGSATSHTVTLYLLPGTYTLKGQGYVAGGVTTFGYAQVTVGPDDTLELDLTGPTIVVDTPAGGSETNLGTVTVAGTVTDASGVATLKVNGTEVAFDPATGAFTYEVTGLVRGANAIVVEATDEEGNTSTLTRTVYRTNTDPVASVEAESLVWEAGLLMALDGTGSTDADGDALSYAWWLDGELVGSENVLLVPMGLGEHTVELVVTDANGASDAASVTVSVVDTIGPAFDSVPADVVLELAGPDGTAWALGEPVAWDASGEPVLIEPMGGTTETWPLGTTVVTWTATDAAGNTATATTRVTVVDTTPPALTVPDLVVLELAGPDGTAHDLLAPVATDASGEVTVTPGAVSAVFPLGDTAVVYTATDGSGNAATATTVVRVVDTTPPTMEALGSITLELASPGGTAFTLPRPVLADLSGGEVSLTNDAPAVFPMGTTVVTWTATDASGNATTATTAVTVVDHTSPALTPPAPVTLELASAEGTPYTMPDPTIDDASGEVTWTCDAPEVFPVGVTVVTYTATDASGNVSTATTAVTVVDTRPPVVLAVTTSPGELWPPDHKMVDISVSVLAEDASGWTAKIVALASDEPEDGGGSGDRYPDMRITGALTCQLRAERCGTEEGRVYTITVELTDPAGNKSWVDVELPVQHDARPSQVWRVK